ncbi:PHD finger protein 3 [Caerostris extrusa]|uniref:PHD finger protein 3 n=1 Tax=Caerostris extrusa TaxID=172846 RepID=A0AAV4SK83_CAEEX|nr:PHD finger protein 3 [Caerostris extrusa]
MSETTDHVQMHLKSSDQKSERCASIPSEPFCASWNPGEQLLPAGVQPTESLSQESSQIKQHASLTPMYVPSTVVPDSSQNGNSSFVPQSFSSFQPCLPLGFSVHTPPPNIRHLLTSSVVSTSFSPPSSLPMNIVPLVGNANNVSNQWSASQLPSNSSNVNEWHAGTSYWNETSKFQNNNIKEDSRHYPSDRSKDYHSNHSSKRTIPIRRRCGKLRKFMRGNWVQLFSKGNSFRNQRRGKRDPPSFKRNPRK